MTQPLTTKLQAALKKLKDNHAYTKERKAAVAEIESVCDQIFSVVGTRERLSQYDELRIEVVRLLLATGEGNMFPGARNYIRHQVEFDESIARLRQVMGDVKEIKLNDR